MTLRVLFRLHKCFACELLTHMPPGLMTGF